jgi:integrase
MFAYILVPWLKHVQRRPDLSPATRHLYARVGRELIGAHIEIRDHVIDLGPFVRSHRADGHSPRSIALYVTVARIARGWAVRVGMLPAETEFRVPRVRIDQREFSCNHATPTPDQVARVLAAMPFDDWRMAVGLIARTGARVGEVLALTGGDLDEHNGTITLGTHVGARKTGRRTFPLDDGSLRELAGRSSRGEQPLFDFAGLVGRVQGVDRRLRNACQRAGVPVFTPQGLRRMVVARLLRSKVDPGTAATLTGHSVEVMLRYYQSVTDDDRRAAVATAHLGLLDDDIADTP